MGHRRATYFSSGRGRSWAAEEAEEEGRYPRLRAASRLGISVSAFDAACDAVGYVATEWHHVGKYASRVEFYDTRVLRCNPRFWEGAVAVYRSKAGQARVAALAKKYLAGNDQVEDCEPEEASALSSHTGESHA